MLSQVGQTIYDMMSKLWESIDPLTSMVFRCVHNGTHNGPLILNGCQYMIVLHLHFKDNNLVFNNNYIFQEGSRPFLKPMFLVNYTLLMMSKLLSMSSSNRSILWQGNHGKNYLFQV